MITVKCFARVREQSGEASLTVDYQSALTVADLRRQLGERNERWQQALSGNLLFACNQTLVDDGHVLTDGDEVAFFPPVTGG